MKTTLILVCALLSIFLAADSSAQCAGWAQSEGGPYDNYGWGITLDEQNNSYVAGYYNGPSTFGNVSVSDTGLFLIKYDSLGSFQWAKTFPGQYLGAFSPLSYSQGAVFLSCTFYQSVSFDTIVLPGGNNPQFAVVKFDLDGNVLWARNYPSTNSAYGYAVYNTASGDVLISGRFNGNLDFDGTILQGPPFLGQCVYLAELDKANGNTMWATSSGVQSSLSFERGYVTRTDAHENILLGGYYTYAISFESQTLDNSANGSYAYCPYVAKFDSNGNAIWIKGATGPLTFTNTYAITLDSLDDVYFSAPLEGSGVGATFDGETLYPENGNFVVCKYDPTGNLLWITQMGSQIADSFSACFSLHVNKNKTLTSYGWGYNELIFGNDTLESVGYSDIFSADFDLDGNYLSSFITGNSGYETFYAAAYDTNDHLYLTGGFTGDTATLGDFGLHGEGTIDSFPHSNVFVWKNCPPGISTIVENESRANASIFPNPVTDLLSVTFPGSSRYVIEVANVFGERMFQSKVDNMGSMQFDVKDFPAGIYFLSVTDEKKNVVTKKFVKM